MVRSTDNSFVVQDAYTCYPHLKKPATAERCRILLFLNKFTGSAINGIVFFSRLPLKVTGYAAGAVVFLCVIFLVVFVAGLLRISFYPVHVYFLAFLAFSAGVILPAKEFFQLRIEKIRRRIQDRKFCVTAVVVSGLTRDKERNWENPALVTAGLISSGARY